MINSDMIIAIAIDQTQRFRSRYRKAVFIVSSSRPPLRTLGGDWAKDAVTDFETFYDAPIAKDFDLCNIHIPLMFKSISYHRSSLALFKCY